MTNRKAKTQPQNETVKSGINFSLGDFIKRPVAGMLFFTTVGVGGLVVNQKNIYEDEISENRTRVKELEKRNENLTLQLHKCDSLLSISNTKFYVLKQLGKVK